MFRETEAQKEVSKAAWKITDEAEISQLQNQR